LFISADWKLVVGFVVLIVTLLIRPQGLFTSAGRL
jgi:branched-subunit amino acid ABC-type transport system permease component